MEQEKLPLDEVVLLLKNNFFSQIEEDDEDTLESYFTPFQARLRLKIPVDTPEFNMALQYLGIRGYYKGHTIPYNPDNAAFMVKENPEGELYIQPLMKRSLMSELENFMEEDENFNNYMREQCKKDAHALLNESNFITFALLTSGPSENFSHILTLSAVEIENMAITGRKSHVFVDNELSKQELLDYVTPYKEGVKSAYERSLIAVPGMEECKDSDTFTSLRNSAREYYKICNKRNVIVDDPIKTKNFIAKLLERSNVPEEYKIDLISKNYISIRRVSKYIYNEYLNFYELGEKLKYKKMIRFSSLGEAEILADLLPLLKNELIKFEKENNY